MAKKDRFEQNFVEPFKYLSSQARIVLKEIKYDCQDINAQIHPNPIFIIGNQKSGTSAIAALLAELTNLSVSIDLKKEIDNPTYHKVLKGKYSFSNFLTRHKLDFSREIVKEPNLTFLYYKLVQYFPQSKFVFVLRDPRDNIRSILDRLRIPGNLPQLEYKHKFYVSPAWNLILENKWLGLEGKNYIENLAVRWNCTADVYLNNQEQILLVYYEDFLKDKTGELNRLADKLGLSLVNDITNMLNVQFQIPGNKHVSWQDFFGENLSQIESVCEKRMKSLNYLSQS